MKDKRFIDAALAKRLLSYNPETGDLVWNERDPTDFKVPSIANRWNKRFAGKVAGYAYQFKKGGTRYLCITMQSKSYRAHIIAWTIHYGSMPKGVIDHIDGNGLNNAISNLRDVPVYKNSQNMKLFKNNSSGVPGVRWEKGKGWRAVISNDGSRRNLGLYRDFFEAVCARKSAEIKEGYLAGHGRI